MTSSKKTYNQEFINNQELNENEPDYEKAELDLLRDGIRRTYTQRFDMMMCLIKTGIMFKNAKIVHNKDPYEN